MFSDCKAPVFSGMPDTERRFLVQRPNSTGSASYVSSCSHSSSSSSSGRGSVSPVGNHIGVSRRVISVPDPGRFSNPGEHDLDQETVKHNQLGKAFIKQNMLSGHISIMIYPKIHKKHSYSSQNTCTLDKSRFSVQCHFYPSCSS